MVPLVFAALLAGSPYEARFLEELALRAYRRQNFEEALDLYAEMQRAAPNPLNLFNMGLAADGLGQTSFAFAMYRAYLDDAPGDGRRATHAERRTDELGRSLALVRVDSVPPGASIHVDDDETSWGRTPATIALRPGAHTVRLERAGWFDAEASVQAQLRGAAAVELTMARKQGRLRVDVEASEAVVELLGEDSDEAGRTLPANETVAVPVGAHRLRVDAPGHLPTELRVRVRFEALTTRSVRLTPQPPARAPLFITVGEARVEVWVDGVQRGRTPASLRDTLGPHRVELKRDGALLWSDTIELEADTPVVRWVELD